ncbi:MAG: undecaprenyl-diphosphate phosphatase [Bacteroidota bacterium]
MTVLKALLLGLIQGLTEFLPVSSSGHLVLGEAILRIPFSGNIAFEVFVHFGTFLSLVTFFRVDVVRMLRSSVDAARRPSSIPQLYRDDQYFRYAALILLGSIPAAVVGLSVEDQVAGFFSDPKLVAVMLLVTGSVLILTRKVKPQEGRDVKLGSSILMGVAQAVAVIPGISRAGSTISTGLFLGVSRENSARFSFLLALPAIFGATALKISEVIFEQVPPEMLLSYLVGTVAAYASGLVAIKVLLEVLKKGKFSWFAYYCYLVGTLGIFLI